MFLAKKGQITICNNNIQMEINKLHNVAPHIVNYGQCTMHHVNIKMKKIVGTVIVEVWSEHRSRITHNAY